jgi:hypothetical protein
MPALSYTCAGTECSPDDSRDIRRRASALIGTIAEPSVREHCDGNTVVFHVVTCVPEGSGQFASHGHTLRLTFRPAATQAGHHEKPGPWQRAGRILRAYHVALIEGGGVSVAVVTPGGSAAEEPFGETGAGLRRGWGVSPGRQQAIACTLQGLVPGGGRLSRPGCRPSLARSSHAGTCGRTWSCMIRMSAGTCRCTGRTAATCGFWPGNAARTPIGMTMAGRLARSPRRRVAW